MAALLALALSGCAQAASAPPATTPSTAALPDALWKHWIRSSEDDAPGVEAYRPEGYAFPPARGRAGFRLERDGRYVEYAIARGDGNTEVDGTWKRVGADTLEVRTRARAVRLRVLSVTDALLKVRAEQ